MIEIYSCWGAADNSYEVNLNAGRFKDFEITKFINKYKMGFIASSDGHDGNPGNASYYVDYLSKNEEMKNRSQLGHYLGSGKVAVLCDKITRENVFDALKSKRCYAVTGAPILLSFSINGKIMGSELSGDDLDKGIEIHVSVKGTDKLASVQIIRNGTTIYEKSEFGKEKLNITYTDDLPDRDQSYFYYVKVIQQDGEMAWSSPIWIE